ncbi:MAG: hypothetical protein RIK87_15680 [Fuerstiella sp.]
MNSFEQMLFLSSPPVAEGTWKLIRADQAPLLPIAIPLQATECDLTLPLELYAAGNTSQTLRFVTLCLAHSRRASPDQWKLRLIIVMLQLETGNPRAAWSGVQDALAWRNRVQNGDDLGPASGQIVPRDWLVLAVAALAVADFEASEQFASAAVSCLEKNPGCCTGDLLADTRADAMTVFAAIRMSQQRLREAELLLELAHDAYLQAGDMEQLVVVLLLMSDVERLSGAPLSSSYLLWEAADVLARDFDRSRHHRHELLHRQVVARRRPPSGDTPMLKRLSLN